MAPQIGARQIGAEGKVQGQVRAELGKRALGCRASVKSGTQARGPDRTAPGNVASLAPGATEHAAGDRVVRLKRNELGEAWDLTRTARARDQVREEAWPRPWTRASGEGMRGGNARRPGMRRQAGARGRGHRAGFRRSR